MYHVDKKTGSVIRISVADPKVLDLSKRRTRLRIRPWVINFLVFVFLLLIFTLSGTGDAWAGIR